MQVLGGGQGHDAERHNEPEGQPPAPDLQQDQGDQADVEEVIGGGHAASVGLYDRQIVNPRVDAEGGFGRWTSPPFGPLREPATANGGSGGSAPRFEGEIDLGGQGGGVGAAMGTPAASGSSTITATSSSRWP